MKLFWGSLSVLTIGLAVGCSATGGGSQFDNEGGGGSGDGGSGAGNQGGAGGAGGGFIPGAGGSGGSTPGEDCTDAAKLIYVLSDENELYSFDPPAKKFTKIGTLGCNTTMQPNSMAVDRNAVAWVNYVESDPFLGDDINGVIYKVSTKDASCDPQPTVQLISNWFRLGMGFSTNDGGMGETLYITGTGTIGAGDSPGLGKINPLSFGVETIANFSPGAFTGQSAELTGTGDGRLYGYYTTSPVQVGQINKATGAVTNAKAITGLATPSAWAFSFWGGSFYLYAAAGLDYSNVTKYDPVAGTIDNAYMTNIGFRIVGAGVSTCAPLEPPK
ncbi:hypothetical protein [Polyangium jinanense]|uniref:Lipoprotein n=1 Tax=Polyangium jinanense TaxID=2829994 RepID=A0A9X3WYQ3_9BACT|nr:hypothetical protein [Polyangium jinanense]MDC3953681.1 hypothetical protein [Polyangium jinanense]MDC3979198.1 hypothetical protein [Polyangium jinanense]